jgi:tripartite-type tricarboxylate transporter receptor subunit TctC
LGSARPGRPPADVIGKLNKEINAVLSGPKMRVRLAELGGMVLSGSPSDFGKLIADETAKWAKVVKASGAKAE